MLGTSFKEEQRKINGIFIWEIRWFVMLQYALPSEFFNLQIIQSCQKWATKVFKKHWSNDEIAD